MTFNPRNFYWNNNCIILPKSVDLPQVSGCISGQPTSGNTFRVNPKYTGPVTRTARHTQCIIYQELPPPFRYLSLLLLCWVLYWMISVLVINNTV